MGSPLYESMMQPQPSAVNPNIQNAIMQAKQILQLSKQPPQQIVQTLIQNGYFSQDRINIAAQQANMITGKNYSIQNQRAV